MAERTHTLLLVDDEEDNLFLLKRTLERDYPVVCVSSAEDALDVFNRQPIDLLIADNRLPGITGIALCGEVARRWPDTMRIIVTGYTEVADLLGAINEGNVYQYVTKPWDAPQLKLTVQRALEAFELQQETKLLVSRLWDNFMRLKDNYLRSLVSLVSAVEAQDRFMAGHAQRVRDLSLKLAREVGVPEDQFKHLEWGALLHDLGTHWVSADILRKPAALDAAELEEMRRHPTLGAELLDFSYAFDEVREIILTHHERWDGSGYPSGIAGEAIPLTARIVSIAETFDALVSDRPHRAAYSIAEARDVVERSAGSHLDPTLVDLFLGLLDAGAFNKDLKHGESLSNA
jgi:putative nucleotidyltransferase with HDIG domain